VASVIWPMVGSDFGHDSDADFHVFSESDDFALRELCWVVGHAPNVNAMEKPRRDDVFSR
jgi:hypothetical protein